jgi:hypothetical protein
MTSNLKHSCRFSCLAVALAIASAAPLFASQQSQAKHAGDVKKSQAEQIALSKIRGGTIRSAELQVANGRHFWAVFVAKPDKKMRRRFTSTQQAERFSRYKLKGLEIRLRNLQKFTNGRFVDSV